MNKLIDLLDSLPPFDPIAENRMVDPVVPFLHSQADSFERWALLRNYELGRPPLSSDELHQLRAMWRR